MARSSYIYTIWKDGNPIAGFTVKHEAVRWARKSGHPMHDLFLWRGRDGASWNVVSGSMMPVIWPEPDTASAERSSGYSYNKDGAVIGGAGGGGYYD